MSEENKNAAAEATEAAVAAAAAASTDSDCQVILPMQEFAEDLDLSEYSSISYPFVIYCFFCKDY